MTDAVVAAGRPGNLPCSGPAAYAIGGSPTMAMVWFFGGATAATLEMTGVRAWWRRHGSWCFLLNVPDPGCNQVRRVRGGRYRSRTEVARALCAVHHPYATKQAGWRACRDRLRPRVRRRRTCHPGALDRHHDAKTAAPSPTQAAGPLAEPDHAGYQMTTPPPISSERAAARSIFANRAETASRKAASESVGLRPAVDPPLPHLAAPDPRCRPRGRTAPG